MKQNTESETYRHIDGLTDFSAKMPRPFNREKLIFSTNGAEKKVSMCK